MILQKLRQSCLSAIPTLSLAILASVCCGCGGSGRATSSPTSTNEWTWMAGSDMWNGTGVYGTKGTGSVSSIPGARELSSRWTDSAGNFWLFGGSVVPPGGSGIASEGNDLWKYDVTSQEWTWEGGSSTPNQPGIYGTQGTASPSNIPGAREAATSWTDASGNFWLFGGIGYDSIGGYPADINDLWKFNTANGTWTWVSGSNVNALTSVARGVYGTEGVPAAANVPGARDGAAGWADSNGKLWLFGGYGYDSAGTFGALNDLWEFGPTANTWTWISGSSTVFAAGVYGTQGVPSAANVPQARERVASWIDGSGNLWFFGGIGWNTNSAGMLNDLWKFDPATNMWAWMSGSDSFDAIGVYGTEGTPAANNGPSNVSCNSTTGICVPSTMMKPRPAGCGAAIAQGAISLGLDVVGAIPAFGNVVSATAAGARAVNGIVAYGGAAYGIATGLPDESPVGAAGAGAGLGLTLADTALEGGKVIPVLGNFLSAGIGLYDGYQLAKTVARCW